MPDAGNAAGKKPSMTRMQDLYGILGISSSAAPVGFQSTRWSVVLAANDSDAQRSSAAISDLYQAYWRPLYAFLRRSGYSTADAQDVVQGLFVHLMSTEVLSYPEPERGRFRSFLLAALKQYLAQQHRRETAEKRGGGRPTLSLEFGREEGNCQNEAVDVVTPEVTYERRWASALIDGVIRQLADEYSARGKSALFRELEVFLRDADPEITYGELADRIGSSEGAVRVAVHRLRRRCGELVRQEVAHTVASPDEIDAELQYLLDLLSS